MLKKSRTLLYKCSYASMVKRRFGLDGSEHTEDA